MTKEQKGILIKFTIFIGMLIVVIIVGISNVFALTNDNSIKFYDNNGSSLTAKTTNYDSTTGESSAIFTTTANSYGGAVMIQTSTPLISGHIYTLFVNVGAANMGGETTPSSKNCIGVGSNYNNAINNYINCNVTPNYTQKSGLTTDKGRGIYFTFIANTNGNYLLVPYTSANTCYDCYQFSYGYNIEDAGNSNNLTQSQVNTVINNQTNSINNSITSSQNAITSNSNANRDAIINNQNANNEALIQNDNTNTDKIIEENKKNFNDCHNSYNLLNYPYYATFPYTQAGVTWNDNNGKITASGTATAYTGIFLESNIQVQANTDYRFFIVGSQNNVAVDITGTNLGININTSNLNNNGYVFNTGSATTISISIKRQTNGTVQADFYPMLVLNSNTTTDYEPYGEEICTNKLDEANKTSKGILGKLGDLLSYINPLSENFFVYKLIELLGNLLKSLFVPSSTFIKNWYDDFKAWFELKLGFIATPFTLFVDFIETFLNLEDTNLVINIPQITVPNFENYVLIEARTFNWGELLNSKQEFRTLWTLYLDFIDVFLILNFLGLCETKYNRIFGGDTTPYEYYTTEETYNINDETGEATNHMLRQRTTRRERVK